MLRYTILFLCTLFFISFKKTENNTVVPPAQYISYYKGGLPIILSVPHGGTIKPAGMPDRVCPGVTVTDKFTIELASDIDTALYHLLGCHTYRVINNLARIKLDPNRPKAEATCNDTVAESNYTTYHQYLVNAENEVQATFGKGLLIDVHGLAASRTKIELGYTLTTANLQLSDAQLDAGGYAARSSIQHLATANANAYSFSTLLRGDRAFGTMLTNKGYPAIPSAAYPQPAGGEKYFDGGYITNTYGSKAGGNIDAIQMETNYTGLRDSNANRKRFADSVALAIKAYLDTYYFAGTPLCR